ncbi:hypothetical protein B4114_2641 [Geobacillus stearothermophilus]|uniref:Uncharacterized protein n=1 Tax=Geobacillus stearothermophilus TaxID=1422 RepID=A0A150NAW6_GEOSE|nr:hypothetical protein B4114_2641 [Geobacillus stearothermophilus]
MGAVFHVGIGKKERNKKGELRILTRWTTAIFIRKQITAYAVWNETDKRF